MPDRSPDDPAPDDRNDEHGHRWIDGGPFYRICARCVCHDDDWRAELPCDPFLERAGLSALDEKPTWRSRRIAKPKE